MEQNIKDTTNNNWLKEFAAEHTDPDFSKNMIIAKDLYLSKNDMVPANMLCIGGSGTGKTHRIAGPNLLQADGSYVINDPHGELYRRYMPYLKDQGYKICRLNLNDLSQSEHYNPFCYFQNDRDIMHFVNTLIYATSTGDRFWDDCTASLYNAVFAYLYHEVRKEDQNVASVMRLLRLARIKESDPEFESTLDIMFRQMKDRNPDSFAATQYENFRMAAGRTRASILISAASRIRIFDLTEVQNLMTGDNMYLENIAVSKTALFVMSSDSDDSLNLIPALLYAQLMHILGMEIQNAGGHRLPLPVTFILDEFSNMRPIPSLEQILAVSKKSGLSFITLMQSIAQLKKRYPRSWEMILANCGVISYLGNGWDSETVQLKIDMLKNNTENLINGMQVLPENHCFVMIRGQKPYTGVLYNPEGHPSLDTQDTFDIS